MVFLLEVAEALPSKQPPTGANAMIPRQPALVQKRNPDCTEIPSMHVSILTEKESLANRALQLTIPGARNIRRDWFTSHFYHCLPLVIANKYGFSVLLESDTSVSWNGGNNAKDVEVTQEHVSRNAVQNVHSHFGSGVITVDNPWVYRVSEGTNLLITAPPNHPVDGLSWMTAVVEADNLRTDFTINIKITRPNYRIVMKAGSPIGHFIPVPRHFGDVHQLQIHPEGAILEAEREAMRDFHRLRHETNRGRVGGHYRAGIDLYGEPFGDHQKK